MAKDIEQTRSKFDGGVLGYIGTNLLVLLISICTLFIGYPWAACLYYKWETKHTTIDDRALVFDGTGAQLFGSYIKWFLLCIITIGIYTLWLPVKMTAWKVKHTHFAD